MPVFILKRSVPSEIVFDFSTKPNENPSTFFPEQGLSTGLVFRNVKTVGGILIGTQQDFGENGYDDSWGFYDFGSADIAIKGKVYKNITGGTDHEIELFVCGDPQANSCSGFEGNFDYNGNPAIITQTGPKGGFSTAGQTVHNNPGAIATGDWMKVTHIGDTTRLYLNNVLCVSLVDDTYSSTKHGPAFFTRPGSPDEDFGFSEIRAMVIDGVNFTATDAATY